MSGDILRRLRIEIDDVVAFIVRPIEPRPVRSSADATVVATWTAAGVMPPFPIPACDPRLAAFDAGI